MTRGVKVEMWETWEVQLLLQHQVSRRKSGVMLTFVWHSQMCS
jgi:hypothetical protein